MSKKKNKIHKKTSKRSMRVWTIALLTFILLLVIVIIVMITQIKTQESNINEPTETMVQLPTMVSTEESFIETSQESSSTVNSSEMETEVDVEATETTVPLETATEETKETSNIRDNTSTAQTNNGSGSGGIKNDVTIGLPYSIPGSTLVLQKVASYEGVYLEDGSDDSVSDVAMILLYNSGSEAVEYAEINVVMADSTLEFSASAIPSKGYVTIQEKHRRGLPADTILECTAEVATKSELEMSSDAIQIVDNGDNSLTVTNLSESEIATVRVFYKYYMEDSDVFVGGITYTAKISNLAANATIVITPSHFASEGSRVVMVRTYDTDA